jgi:hypothetical protein
MGMTDQELIDMLRDQHDFKCDLAADRIEELLESGKGLANAFAVVAVKREITEAKLEKAVWALEEIASYDTGLFAGIAYTARTVLDELEKTE